MSYSRYTPVRLVLITSLLLTPALAQAQQATSLLKKNGFQRGMIVQIGCEDPQGCLDLHDNGQFVVQAIDSDPEQVAEFRRQIEGETAYGPVSARLVKGDKLPFVDNLLNMVVVRESLGFDDDEIMRVLRPLGIVMKLDGDRWTTKVKPWPNDIDEWTHFLHDATGNAVSKDQRVGPPRRLQWSAGPMWGRSHEMNNSFPALVTAQGRMYYIFDYGLTGMEDARLGERWTLIARDAFNGSLLWERPLSNWGSHLWQTRALRFFGGDMARRLVVNDDKLFITFDYGEGVHIIDGATGTTLGQVPNTADARDILIDGDQIFVVSQQRQARRGGTVKLNCYDLVKEQPLWQADDRAISSQTLCVGPDEVVFHNKKSVVCLNRQDGTVRWAYEDAPPAKSGGKGGKMVLLTNDKVVVSSRSRVFAIATATGKLAWESPGPKGNSMREYDLFFAQGTVWCSGPDGTVVGYDIKNGKPSRQIDASSIQSQGHHLRCYRAKATEDYLITQFRGVEFLSLNEDPHTNQDWLRGTCTYGVMPANGFLYVPPHSCLCYSAAMMHGLNAFASDAGGEDAAVTYSLGPLEKGPAYGSILPKQSPDSDQESWPGYRHDARRTGASTCRLPGSMKRTWKVELGTAVTPPVADSGRLFLAAKDRHAVIALDATSGEQLWSFYADARIDSPPTIHRGLLLFGSADGFVYCVRATDGHLAWRRRLAPTERWMGVDGQLESVWRLHGSVLIEQGLAYCCAGRSSYLDGGLFLSALDVATGEVKHETRLHTSADTRVDYQGKDFVPAYHIEGAHSDILVAQGDYIYLNQFRFTRDLKERPGRYLAKEESTYRPSINLDNKDYVNEDIYNVTWRNQKWDTYDKLAGILVDENESVGERDLGLHLFTTSGFLDNSFFNRSFWCYSKTWTGFNHTNLAPKSGQLVVIGPQHTYALKAYTSRYPLSPKLDPQTKGYLLVADDNDNEPTLDPRAWGKDKGMGFSRGAPPIWHQWLPIRVTSMVLASDKLVVCGPPDVVKEGDPMAAFEGRLGSELWTISAADGTTLSKQQLSEMPLFDGMIAAEGRLIMCTSDGDVICME